MKEKSKSFLRKLKPVERNCPYCKQEVLPDFKVSEKLRIYVSDRGKILGKDRTGLCSKHQRRIVKEIKRARFLGLLPFTANVK